MALVKFWKSFTGEAAAWGGCFDRIVVHKDGHKVSGYSGGMDGLAHQVDKAFDVVVGQHPGAQLIAGQLGYAVHCLHQLMLKLEDRLKILGRYVHYASERG